MEKKENLKYATPIQILKLYPGLFSLSSIRWHIFNEHENGMSRCIRRIGRKIIIDLKEFERWIDSKESKIKR